ncbi:MAG: CRISPR-associated endonuclease Cas3'' [Planctomycetales bacterium]|nr:CRISPR-associated endonuclease Cas3'' [Planctomycetales bacterium]
MHFAHSAKPDVGISAQPYSVHIRNVHDRAFQNARAAGALAFADLYQDVVRLAAEFHDLGKLDPANQAVLNGSAKSKRSLPINHVDAGTAHLWCQNTPISQMAAMLVYAHHTRLPGNLDISNKLRDIEIRERIGKVRDWTDRHIANYISAHSSEFSQSLVSTSTKYQSAKSFQVFARMALSCLVDADHTDTALNYRNESEIAPIHLRAAERLEQLGEYVARLQKDAEETDRNRLRADVYSACSTAAVARGIVSCDSPVGSGKTTAVMSHLLAMADKHGMRRVFVVLPFTNIITQSAEVYRRCLVLDDEDPEQVVGEHHHRAEFEDIASRHLSYRWQSPIIVTTAIQFFETLAAARTGALRKLHQLANSVIFIDESHAALPTQFWPVAWKWLLALRDDWNCHIVLGSGSLSEFWRIPDVCKSPETVPALIRSQTSDESLRFELDRIHYRTKPETLTLEPLVDWIGSINGPRLLIVNTVQSAAFIAHSLRDSGSSVEHLSTALTPIDRKTTLDHIKRRLDDKTARDWTLVATSCVEAGVDISFAVGFRERCSLNSLLQTAGRVNRNGEFGRADVWDIQLVNDQRLRAHPAFEDSAEVLGELFDIQLVSPEFCTEAMRREINRAGMKQVAERLVAAEAKREFETVESLFRVIDNATDCAIVDKRVINRLRSHEPVTFREIQDASVQIYSNRRSELALEPIAECPGLYAWTLKYNRFLGYMAGVIDSLDFVTEGGAFI